jgi:hypothetical protein
MTFGSWWISLAERSCSSFVLIVLFICVQVRIFLLLSATPTRAVSGRSRLRRTVFPTGTHRCRSSEEAQLSSRVKSMCLSWETNASAKTLIIFWSTFWILSFVNPNICHLICNNFNLNYVCVCSFSLRRESPNIILRDKPLISEVVLSYDVILLHFYEKSFDFLLSCS